MWIIYRGRKPHIVYRAGCWHVYYRGAWLGSTGDPRRLRGVADSRPRWRGWSQ
jgi:hypothetical protein